MKEHGRKLFCVFTCALALAVHAKPSDEAVQEWSAKFPDVHSVISGPAQSQLLVYLFLFKKDAADIFCKVTCTIATAKRTHSERFSLADGAGITAMKMEVIVKSQFPELRRSWILNRNEVNDLFSNIASHEVFRMKESLNGLEPGPIILDSYPILLMRRYRKRMILVARVAGASVPVDTFVTALWGMIEAKLMAPCSRQHMAP